MRNGLHHLGIGRIRVKSRPLNAKWTGFKTRNVNVEPGHVNLIRARCLSGNSNVVITPAIPRNCRRGFVTLSQIPMHNRDLLLVLKRYDCTPLCRPFLSWVRSFSPASDRKSNGTVHSLSWTVRYPPADRLTRKQGRFPYSGPTTGRSCEWFPPPFPPNPHQFTALHQYWALNRSPPESRFNPIGSSGLSIFVPRPPSLLPCCA